MVMAQRRASAGGSDRSGEGERGAVARTRGVAEAPDRAVRRVGLSLASVHLSVERTASDARSDPCRGAGSHPRRTRQRAVPRGRAQARDHAGLAAVIRGEAAVTTPEASRTVAGGPSLSERPPENEIVRIFDSGRSRGSNTKRREFPPRPLPRS